MPLSQTGDSTQNPCSGHFERNGDVTPIEAIGCQLAARDSFRFADQPDTIASDHGSYGSAMLLVIRVNPRNPWRMLPLDCKPANSDQVIQLQLRAPAFPRGLELLLHKASIVFLALDLEGLLQPEQ